MLLPAKASIKAKISIVNRQSITYDRFVKYRQANRRQSGNMHIPTQSSPETVRYCYNSLEPPHKGDVFPGKTEKRPPFSSLSCLSSICLSLYRSRPVCPDPSRLSSGTACLSPAGPSQPTQASSRSAQTSSSERTAAWWRRLPPYPCSPSDTPAGSRPAS